MSKVKGENLSPIQKTHAYALINWSGYTEDGAIKKVTETPLEELEELTGANGSIAASIAGIEKLILNGQQLDVEQLKKAGNKEYYKQLVEQLRKMDKPTLYLNIIKILEEIHNRWVKDSAYRYGRGDNKLFQHLPTELIGLKEVCKDLMFLAPFLQELGIDVGDLKVYADGSEFVPSPEIAEAYATYSEQTIRASKYGKDYNGEITPEMIAKAIETYPSLHETGEVQDKRLAYMQERTTFLSYEANNKLGLDNEKEAE